jgi:hypothetical protein
MNAKAINLFNGFLPVWQWRHAIMEQAAAQRKERIGDFPTALEWRALVGGALAGRVLADHRILALIADRDSHNALAVCGG